MVEHVVEEGECFSSIAGQYGFQWEDLWNDDSNRALRELRQDPNVLNPGDVVRIPDRMIREESRPTGQRHRFVHMGATAQVRLQLLGLDQKPRPSLRYVATVNGRRHEGTTDADGYLTVPAAPGEEKLSLHVWDQGREETYELDLGQVDPTEETKGWQQRLINLGYPEVEEELGEPGDLTSQALAAFQRTAGLPETGQLDDVTRRHLARVHGS